MDKRLASFMALLCASALIISLTVTIIDPYLKATKWSVNLFDFLDAKHDAVYFLGDSYAGCGIDPLVIEDSLKDSEVYNLFFKGDTPKHRIIELANIIESRPKMVILCVSYRGFMHDGTFSYPLLEERASLVANKIRLDPESRALFNETELDLIEMNPLEQIAYKRRFLAPAIRFMLPTYLMSEHPKLYYYFWKRGYLIRSEKPLNFDFKNQWIPGNQTSNQTREYYAVRFRHSVEPGNNNNKRAFRHIVKRLKEAHIHVIVVNMPLNPLYASCLTNETRQNYQGIVTSVGCPYYNLENQCLSLEFSDGGHLNYAGRQNLTRKMAEILEAECVFS